MINFDASRPNPIPEGRPTSCIRLMKVMASFGSGGTEGQVLNLVRSMDRKQFDLRFACLQKMGELLGEVTSLDIPIAEFRIRSLYGRQTFQQQLRFARHIRAEGTQIIHSYNFYANMFAIPAARLARTPVILASIRDRGVYLTPAQQFAQKWICSLADRILVNANAIRDWLLEQGYPGEKISVIKNGIDTSLYAGTKKDSSPVRKNLGIPGSVPLVVMISRLNPQKGVDDFIKAAALINGRYPDVRFLIAGAKVDSSNGVLLQDTRYVGELQALANDLGVGDRVIFAGHRTDTPEILAEATLSVLPSHSEGLSNSLLESMAAGVPTVATDVGGNPELVKNHVNGFLVPVKSPERLAQAMLQILDSPGLARSLGTRARAMACNGFSLAKMTSDTQALYYAELTRTKRAVVHRQVSPS